MGLSSLRRYHDRPGAVIKVTPPALITREAHEAALYAQGKAYEAKLTEARAEHVKLVKELETTREDLRQLLEGTGSEPVGEPPVAREAHEAALDGPSGVPPEPKEAPAKQKPRK